MLHVRKLQLQLEDGLVALVVQEACPNTSLGWRQKNAGLRRCSATAIVCAYVSDEMHSHHHVNASTSSTSTPKHAAMLSAVFAYIF